MKKLEYLDAMYTEFYGLKEKPFNLTPSSRFIYFSESHKEALALLTYGISERKGFILLTGEVGTGKTTMTQALLSNLDAGIQYIYLSNPLLSPSDLINYLAFSALKKKVHFKSKAEFILEFEGFLKDCLQHQKNFVLIIDEAQKLSFELLEEIRLLSNMETADEKLINIILVGQPELNEHLSDPRCRPLLQRISIRHHINPLSLEETGEYVRTRMKVAGAKEEGKIFSTACIKTLNRLSRGYPRMINILADNALLLGYAREKGRITPAMIEQCYEDIKIDGSFERPEQRQKEEEKAEGRQESLRPDSWKWIAFFILIMLGFSLAISPKGLDLMNRYFTAPPADQTSTKDSQGDMVPPQSRVNGKITRDKEIQGSTQTQTAPPPAEPEKQELASIAVKPVEAQREPEIPNQKPVEVPSKRITVRRGDTLLELATRVYGFADEGILELVKAANPDIEDVNRIEIGQEIVFPPIDAPTERLPVFTVHIASFTPFESARDLFQRLMGEGYEVYIMPVYNPEKGKVFRVTLGSFKSRREADAYAAAILRRGVSTYAESIQLEMR